MFKHCFMATLIGLLLVACAQKQNTIQPVTLQKSCQTPIIAYQLENIKIGEFNDLQIPKKQVLSLIENALQNSGCFIKAKQNKEDFGNPLRIILQSLKFYSLLAMIRKQDIIKARHLLKIPPINF